MYQKLEKTSRRLKKVAIIAIVAVFIAGTANAQKPKLAVMDFMAGVGLYQNDVNGLSDMLINSLFNTGRFELIERGQLCQLIGETNLQKSSLSAGQLQQLAIKGVNFLLLGTVNLTGGEYNIDVRVVDVGTGQLYSTAGVTKLSTQTYRDMMPKLASELATKLPQVVNVTVSPEPKIPNEDIMLIAGYLKVTKKPLVQIDGSRDWSETITNIVQNANKTKMFGINSWRVPNPDEAQLIKNEVRSCYVLSIDFDRYGRSFYRESSNCTRDDLYLVSP